MASDCRIGFRLNLFHVLILKVLLPHLCVLVVLLSSGSSSYNNYFVQSAPLYELCDDIYDCSCSKIVEFNRPPAQLIECPNDQLYESHPITAKVHTYNGTGALELICDYSKEDFNWRLVKGLNFKRENQKYVVATLSITNCAIPPESDSLEKLLTHLDIDPGDVTTYKYVSHRQLGTFPDYMLAPLVNLTFLDLTQNKLTSIPNLSYFPNLRTFEFHTNLITSLPAGTFSKNVQLQRVALRANSLTSMDDRSLPDSLEMLDLQRNSISSITRDTFSNLKKLRYLFLNQNTLENLDEYAFSNLTQLGELRIDWGRFVTFPILDRLPSLENVSMSNNLYFKSLINPVSSTVLSRAAGEDEDVGDSSTIASRNKPPPVTVKDLPRMILLDLTGDGLADFPQLDNLPNLTNLLLSKNRITKIPDVLAKLTSIRKLDLSENQIADLPSLESLSLVELDLSSNLLTQLRKSTFSLNNLQKLNLARNKISSIDPTAFQSLEKLTDLNLSNNQITLVPPADANSGFGYLPFTFCVKLKRVDLSRNSINSLSILRDDIRFTLSALEKLDLSFNKLTEVSSIQLNFLQNKLELDLRNNEITRVSTWKFDEFVNQGAQLLVRLGANPLNCDCDTYEFKNLTLSSQAVFFDIDNLYCAGPNFPKNLTNLLFQAVSKEDLTCAVDERFGCPEDCSCWRRPADSTLLVECAHKYDNFTLPDLMPMEAYRDEIKSEIVLNLSDNEITHVPDDYVSSLPVNVRAVDLRKNKLRSLAFLKVLADNSTIKFNLSENPFPCYDCNFHSDSRSQFSRIGDSDNLTCLIQDSGQVEKALDFDYESICSTHFVGIIVPVVVSAVLLVIVAVVYVRNGWAIRAFLYSKGYGFLLCDRFLEDDEEKLYDAFVSYSHRDEAWVLEELVNRLEGQEGFKLCLHFRDWTPGDWIPDQIVRSVDQSRRTVVVLSKNFVDSVWSRLEFKAAHSQALSDGSNRLILVLMGEDLTEKDVQDDDLRVYMKMNTYIKWNDPWFWHKLKYALPHRKCLVEENRNHYMKRVQRERAIQLDKMRTKMENQVPA